ncbi:MAG: hypothetical protein V4787_11770 [Pseudomonadota bacterium]
MKTKLIQWLHLAHVELHFRRFNVQVGTWADIWNETKLTCIEHALKRLEKK